MSSVNVYNVDGKEAGSIELPKVFDKAVREELIRRAVVAEQSMKLQPQGHYLLAGMQTTATYYGRYDASYRTGRHMGIAIRPREKLGGGRQGQVKRIPSAVKGKRAHPHKIEKRLAEGMNNREYQAALVSSIAASAKHMLKGVTTPIIIDNAIESLKSTREVTKFFKSMQLQGLIEEGRKKYIKKGLRRSTRRVHYKNTVALIVNSDKGIVKAARNIPGISVCTIDKITVNMMAPGGNPGRISVWSADAVKGIDGKVGDFTLKSQAKYYMEN
ncbi:50S ribosomal protein L4P [mine drainage metagenome]|uniref:50S ribosomal protein L4P n=1 Tax=mine drainage metagenome TaxID=410659 RepID=T0ZG74_9ZZZZ